MDSDRDRTDGGGAYAPAPPDARTFVELGTFSVDGETFAVRRSDDDGSTHYDWVAGPNDGYGFSTFDGTAPLSTFGGTAPLSRERHLDSIRDFLAGIDPATGYLADP